MALPVYPNAISLSAVNVELSYTSTQSITLNDAAVRALFVKASGAIAMSDGHGKSAALPDINSHTWAGAVESYTFNGYRTLLRYHAVGQVASTTSFTLTNSATVDFLLMDGKAAYLGTGGDGQDTRDSEDCCVCDGGDNHDHGGNGGSGGEGGAIYVGTANLTGGVTYNLTIGLAGYPTTGFSFTTASPNRGPFYGYGGQGEHADCNEYCQCNDSGPTAGWQGAGEVETWTGQSLRFGQPGQGGGGGVGNCGCGQYDGVGATGSDGSGYGAGGGGGGGSTPYLPPTSGRGVPDSATAGGAILVRYRYRPV